MANYMLELFDNPNVVKTMGIAALKHIEEHYDLEKQIQKLFEVLQTVVKNK